MSRTVNEYEKIANELSKNPDYRILRRLRGLSAHTPRDKAQPTYKGLYVDCETTGLDLDKDEIIEFGGIPFDFTADGYVTRIGDRVHGYNEPKIKGVSDEITKITGITQDMVKGQVMPAEVVTSIADSQLIISHNAAFDRPMVERNLGVGSDTCWGCSMDQVPWDSFGISGRRLEYLLMSLGYFYQAHNALSDCDAGMFALLQTYKDRTGLSYILEASRKTTYLVWAIGSPFQFKDALKGRGYFWNTGDDGRPKAWNKVIDETNLQSELDWLNANARCAPRADKITAFNRYSKRVGHV